MAYRICKMFHQTYMAGRIASSKASKDFLGEKSHTLAIVKNMQCNFLWCSVHFCIPKSFVSLSSLVPK